MELIEAVAALEPTADEQAQARRVLLALLRDQTRPGMARTLADTIAALEPTAEEQAQARRVLLALLRDQTDPGTARTLADTITALEPTAEEQAQARRVLLALLGLAARARHIVRHGISARTDPRLAQSWRTRSPRWSRQRKTERKRGRSYSQRCSAPRPTLDGLDGWRRRSPRWSRQRKTGRKRGRSYSQCSAPRPTRETTPGA